MKIIKMPNGDGLRAKDIKSVRFAAGEYDSALRKDYPPRVLVNGASYPCETNEEALAERDRILGEWEAAAEGTVGPSETRRWAIDLDDSSAPERLADALLTIARGDADNPIKYARAILTGASVETAHRCESIDRHVWDPDVCSLGSRIRDARTQVEISLRDLAYLIGVTHVELGAWERGLSEPDDEQWARLRHVLPLEARR